MNLNFNFTRTLQAAGVLLEYEKGRRMSTMRLLKLLYVADREALAEMGRPITGDQALAMKQGPVLSRTYDLIRGQSARSGEWDHFIHKDGYGIELVADPGRGDLSKGEVAKLLEVADRYRNLDDWELSEETHKFEEWKKNYPGNNEAKPIPWEEALAALGRTELAEAIERDESDRR
ncbi:MAG: SocA family protein, partial [Planctomycetes bacterium]|nr:SocA family protein [Planctomycetota bacterium]